jgi:hypothetical protein
VLRAVSSNSAGGIGYKALMLFTIIILFVLLDFIFALLGLVDELFYMLR